MKYNGLLRNIIIGFLSAFMCSCIVVSVSSVPFNGVSYNSADAISLPAKAQLIYNNTKFSMSPFILITGGQLNKVSFP